MACGCSARADRALRALGLPYVRRFAGGLLGAYVLANDRVNVAIHQPTLVHHPARALLLGAVARLLFGRSTEA